MSDFLDHNDEDPLQEFLRQMMGDQEAESVIESLRAQGIRPQDLSAGMTVDGLKQAFAQMDAMMNSSSDPVHWTLAADTAKQGAYSAQTREPSAAQAQQVRQALSVADLWLDAVTPFSPGPVERQVWSRYSWVDQTLDTWKRITEPVVVNIVRAFSEAFSGRIEIIGAFPGMGTDPATVVPRLMAMMFGHTIGQALAGLAQDSFGSTDVGLPLARPEVTALLPQNIELFSVDLDIPHEEVVQFLAVRECAHHRLFASVPWLASDLIHAVESYSAEIALDLEAIENAARSLDLNDLQNGHTFIGAEIFATTHTPRQTAALDRLETLLALVEGWVEVVTRQAVAPYLPHHEALTELMRRRRATGAPAEAVLGDLLGLKLRPRQSRGAAKLMQLVEAESGRHGREDLWRHPDFIPQSQDLAEPESYLLLQTAVSDAPDEFDSDLEKLLDGTLGWADGLDPKEPSSTD